MALDPTSSTRVRPQRPTSRVSAVISRFHADLTGAMWRSAQRELEACGIPADNLREVWVPGTFELPIVARSLAAREDVDAVLCLGLVLKGQTRHDEYVAQGAVQGIVRASMDTETPILFGVLTCETLQQAKDRALPEDEGGKEDKGREVARAAVETLLALDEATTGGRRPQADTVIED